MVRPCKTVLLIAFVALLSAGPAFTQAPSTEDSSKPATAPPTVAYIYVQTHQGVNVYDATAAGELTLVKGSPFPTTGQMGGVNGKYLISVGTTNIRVYAIEPNGAIASQRSNTDTQNFNGGECGSTGSNGISNGAMLDGTGKYFYVQLFGATYGEGYYLCSAWQTYQVTSDGNLEFLGVTEMLGSNGYHGSAGASTVPTISSDDLYGFAICYCYPEAQNTVEFRRQPDNALGYQSSFKETDPKPNPAGDDGNYFPFELAADPTGHLAALVNQPFAAGYPPPQLASYTIDYATGSITSTNTWADMPVTQSIYPRGLSMSTTGKLLAVSNYPGLQLFHFNRAAPITPFGDLLLPNIKIDQFAWDNDNHLYALSYESNQLYVYTVTPTSISAAAGSPYSVQNSYGSNGLIVVPKR